jgi:hypothetical protein
MRAGAPLLIAFQSGLGERVDRASAYGQPVAMTYFRHRQQDVMDDLVAAGFVLYASVQRARAPSQDDAADVPAGDTGVVGADLRRADEIPLAASLAAVRRQGRPRRL